MNINGIEKILFSAHAVIASTLQVPELELDEAEAQRLAAAIQNVNNAYRVEFDPKKAALIDLGTACGVIYGPRFVSIFLRKKQEMKLNKAPFAKAAPPPKPTVQEPPSNGAVVFDPANIKVMN